MRIPIIDYLLIPQVFDKKLFFRGEYRERDRQGQEEKRAETHPVRLPPGVSPRDRQVGSSLDPLQKLDKFERSGRPDAGT